MATELHIQQVVGGVYIVGTANETGLSADKHAWFYNFPARYGAVDVFGFNYRIDGVASVNAAVGNTVPGAVFSVFAADESNFLNGYFPAPAVEIYGTTIGLSGQAVLDTPVRVELGETLNVGIPDVVATTEVGGFSMFSAFTFQSVDH